MKRFLAIVLTVVLLVGLLPTTSVAATQYAYVVGGMLRLRMAASFSAATINSYGTGTRVEILGTSASWYYVRTPDGNVGYMYGSYLSFNSTGLIDNGSGTATVTSTNGYGVRLRRGPGTGYAIIGLYAVGTVATVLQRGSYWSRISINGVVGYMMNQFLNFGGGSGGGGGTTDGNATIWSRNGYGVRLRTGPSKSYSIIGVYSVGTSVNVLEYGTTWCKIQVGSRVGYMMTEFLNIRQSTEVTAVTLSNTTPVIGDILSAKSITPSGAKVDYSWIVDGQVVGVDSELYLNATSAVGYEGKQITLRVTGKDGYTGSAIATTEAVVADRISLESVTLNNETPAKNDTVSIVSTVPDNATYKCVWYVDGKQVSTSATLKISDSYLDKAIQLVVTGTGLYTGDVTVDIDPEDSPTLIVNTVNLTTGEEPAATANVGHKLQMQANTTQASFQWVVKNAEGEVVSTPKGKELSITSKYKAGYTITPQYKGTGSYAENAPDFMDGDDISITADQRITKIALSPLANLSFTKGTGSTDDTGTKLSVKVTSTDSTANKNPDSYFTYSWFSDNDAVGEDSSTYTVTETDIGHKIRVEVKADKEPVDGENWTTEVFTATTNEVVTAPLVAIDIEGSSFNVGDEVGLSSTVPQNASIRYINWYVNNKHVGTGNTYTIKQSDARSNAQTSLKAVAYAASPYTGSRSHTVNIEIYSEASATSTYDVLDTDGVVIDTRDEAAVTDEATPVDETTGDDTDTGDDINKDDDTDTGDDINKDDDTDTGDDINKDDDTDTGDDINKDDDTDTGDDINKDDDTDTGDDINKDDDTDTGSDIDEQTQSTYTAALYLSSGTLSAVVNPTPEGMIAYRWYIADQELVGVTGATYTLNESDWGQTFRVDITITNADGSTITRTAIRTPSQSDETEDEWGNSENMYTDFTLTNNGLDVVFQNRYVP